MFAKLLKHKLIEKDMKITDVAKALETSPQNLSQKLKRDNFSEKEMEEIAAAVGCTLEISFKDAGEQSPAFFCFNRGYVTLFSPFLCGLFAVPYGYIIAKLGTNTTRNNKQILGTNTDWKLYKMHKAQIYIDSQAQT